MEQQEWFQEPMFKRILKHKEEIERKSNLTLHDVYKPKSNVTQRTSPARDKIMIEKKIGELPMLPETNEKTRKLIDLMERQSEEQRELIALLKSMISTGSPKVKEVDSRGKSRSRSRSSDKQSKKKTMVNVETQTETIKVAIEIVKETDKKVEKLADAMSNIRTETQAKNAFVKTFDLFLSTMSNLGVALYSLKTFYFMKGVCEYLFSILRAVFSLTQMSLPGFIFMITCISAISQSNIPGVSVALNYILNGIWYATKKALIGKYLDSFNISKQALTGYVTAIISNASDKLVTNITDNMGALMNGKLKSVVDGLENIMEFNTFNLMDKMNSLGSSVDKISSNVKVLIVATIVSSIYQYYNSYQINEMKKDIKRIGYNDLYEKQIKALEKENYELKQRNAQLEN